MQLNLYLMRFPSFIKLPRYKRFDITPRYYDPIKEEIQQRTERIKKEMKTGEVNYTPSKINFERRSKSIPSSSFLQLMIAAVLCLACVGWLYYGNGVFYALWLIVPVYLIIRLKKSRNS